MKTRAGKRTARTRRRQTRQRQNGAKPILGNANLPQIGRANARSLDALQPRPTRPAVVSSRYRGGE
eukprot:2543420-Lingulodinium_polyedra.AAC.1